MKKPTVLNSGNVLAAVRTLTLGVIAVTAYASHSTPVQATLYCGPCFAGNPPYSYCNGNMKNSQGVVCSSSTYGFNCNAWYAPGTPCVGGC
jgi:hypothetical protein